MRRKIFSAAQLLFLLAWIAPCAGAATIQGKVFLEGDPGENPTISMGADPFCKSAHDGEVRDMKVLVNPDKTLQNVFVYIKSGISEKIEPPQTPAVLDQKGCLYSPRVMAIQAGQPLSIKNSDATLHNVHGLGKQNPEFNLGMPMPNMKLQKTFFNPEVMMKLKCDVHPWMSAYVGVLPHHFAFVTAEQGTFQIAGLAPGDYTVEAWHEVYGTRTQNIKITAAEETAALDFKFSAGRIQDEASGVSIRTGVPEPAAPPLDDARALELPRKQTGWWLPESISTFSPQIDHLFYVILWLTGIVFIGVQGTLIAFLVLYRSRGKKEKAYYTHGSAAAEAVWTVIPAIILVFLAFAGQRVWSEVKMRMPDTPDTVRVRVLAEQYAWNIQYPGTDGKFDTADDILKINQLHIPAGKPVRATLISVEKEGKPAVIHSFFLPEFRLKQDVVPGMAIDVWFEARRTGKYEIACAEFCGLGHYRMKGFLYIHTQEGFNAWLKENSAAPEKGAA